MALPTTRLNSLKNSYRSLSRLSTKAKSDVPWNRGAPGGRALPTTSEPTFRGRAGSPGQPSHFHQTGSGRIVLETTEAIPTIEDRLC